MIHKKSFLRIFLSLEIVLFGLYYYYGPQGLRTIYRMKRENKALEESIAHLQEVIKNLEQEKKDFLQYPFYREQIAREQLQMMKPGEEIYIYEKT